MKTGSRIQPMFGAPALAAAALWLVGPPALAGGLSVSKAERIEYIREAEVWSPIDTASVDMRKGPGGGRRLSPDGEITCQFHVPGRKPSGRTAKFYCRMPDGKVQKIKYGADNKEVYGELTGSRLLWALGFYADHMQPVRVRCQGCPEDPWRYIHSIRDFEDPPPVPDPQERVFEPALLEHWFAELIEVEEDDGVGWDEIMELRSRDPEKAELQRVHREALTLLAGFIRHADSKASNQTLGCPAGGVATENGRRVCSKPVIYIGDLGGAGGWGWRPLHAGSLAELTAPSKVGFEKADAISIWKGDPDECVLRVYALPNATLKKARISEDGRRFLAERLALLRRDQVAALAEVSRSDLRDEEIENPDGTRRPVTLDDRVELFERHVKREILDHRCPATVEK